MWAHQYALWEHVRKEVTQTQSEPLFFSWARLMSWYLEMRYTDQETQKD